MALTAAKDVPQLAGAPEPLYYDLPMAAAAVIYAGAAVARDADGNAIAAVASPTGIVIGRAESTVDNAAGGEYIRVKPGTFLYDNGDGITNASRFMPVYQEDDETVYSTDGGSTRALCGFVVDVNADGVYVYQSPLVSMFGLGLSMAERKVSYIVRGASTANVADLANFTVANDGITLVQGEEVLLKNQAAQEENGIYTCGVVAAGLCQLTRSSDYDDDSEILDGTTVIVREGTAGADTAWEMSSDEPLVIGTDALVFSQVPFGYGAVGDMVTVGMNGANAGVANTAARIDHRHQAQAAAAGGVAIDDVGAEGTSNDLARADHVHTVTGGSPAAELAGAVAADGVAVTFSRSDHVHAAACAAAGGVAIDDVAAEGTADTFCRSDHVHTVTGGVPVDIGTANAAGVGTDFARDDHVHAIGDAVIAPIKWAVPDVDGLGGLALLRVPIVAGVGGAADDIAIYTTDAPFGFRVIETVLYCSTASGGSTVTLRDVAGGGGNAVSDALSSAATGVVRNTALTATLAIATSGSLFIRRSDNTVAGELHIYIQPE